MSIPGTPIRLCDIPQHIPTRPDKSTVHKWWKYGIRGGIKLETTLIGGRRFTCQEWIDQFMERLNRQGRKRREITVEDRLVEAELATMGITLSRARS
jgi:hypothetical protein